MSMTPVNTLRPPCCWLHSAEAGHARAYASERGRKRRRCTMAANLNELRRELLETAARVNSSGLLSMSGHGNLSLRVAGKDEMLFTAGGSLRDLPPQAIVRIRLDGTLLEGELPPIANAVVHMHTAVYQDIDDVACVLHTHSPYATAFAVAGREIECWSEAMAIFGLAAGVPLAAYGPRGSELAVANIRAQLS